MDSSPPGSSVHGILQARILGWVAILFSRIFPTQELNPHLLCLLHRQAGSLPPVPPRKPKYFLKDYLTLYWCLGRKEGRRMCKSESCISSEFSPCNRWRDFSSSSRCLCRTFKCCSKDSLIHPALRSIKSHQSRPCSDTDILCFGSFNKHTNSSSLSISGLEFYP